MGFLDKIKSALGGKGILSAFSAVDEDFYEELEEKLILSDLGMETSLLAVEKLRERVKGEKLREPEAVRAALRDILAGFLAAGEPSLDLSTKPSVVLVIGVNGVGKTTTIGKLGARLHGEGKRVLFCAADTFRAAAADQLEIWAGRAGAELVRQHEGADPAAVIFDGLSAARARGADVVLCDTAGRLHNKQNLMNELSKISRVIDRTLPDAARETLLVLDATTGQNGLTQAKLFKQAAGLTGVILTKLDGTARGGIVIAIARELQLPVKYVGVGEGVDDLLPFDPAAFVEALV
ncbi:MAG TPA: signal recognition particle-docking protein FtsY [Oscillospiraceae bacterium]|nr:signal recognition particle-docking protein FtsY [Oscillospiraceae bacterium]